MRGARPRSPFVVAAAVIALAGCDWDTFDPRVGPVTSTGGAGGSGGTGAAGGAGASGGAGGGPVDPIVCGTIALMQETFNDGTRDHIWYEDLSSGASTTEANGSSLVITGGDNSGDFAAYRSARRYDLTGGSIAVEVRAVPTQTIPENGAIFRVELDNENAADFFIADGLLQIRRRLSGGNNPIDATIAYDPTAHRFLRFREAEGVLHWEVSPSGSGYTAVASLPIVALFPMSRVRVMLGAAAGSSTPGVAEFDNVSGQRPGAVNAWCPASYLVDDFEDGFRSEDWFNESGSNTSPAREVDGRLVISLTPNADVYREYASSQSYDLTGGGVSVEVPELSSAPSVTYLTLAEDRRRLEIRAVSVVEPDDSVTVLLEAAIDDADMDENVLVSEPYSADAHRFWRIREQDDTTFFETSPDGAAWTELARRSPNPVTPVTAFKIELGAASEASTAAPGQTLFDNLNILP